MKDSLLYVYPPVPVGLTSGVVVGRVVSVAPHLNAQYLRLALVDLGSGEPVQIVFGGPPNVQEGDLVPVAPPGSRIPGQKMRRRRYRGESSYGMLCSLAELGWNPTGPDEVALLRNVTPGDCLDGIPPQDRQPLVINMASAHGAELSHDTQLPPSLIKEAVATNDCRDEIRANQSPEAKPIHLDVFAVVGLADNPDHCIVTK